MATKKTVAKKTVAKFAKANAVVREAESKHSAIDNLKRRIAKRLGIKKDIVDGVLYGVIASIQETVSVKGSLNIPEFAKFEVVDKKASEGTIQFGDRKGEKWTKPAHKAIKISKVNIPWAEVANDEAELTALTDVEEVWEEETEEEMETEVDVETPAKKAPAKKAPAKKAPAKKAPAKK